MEELSNRVKRTFNRDGLLKTVKSVKHEGVRLTKAKLAEHNLATPCLSSVVIEVTNACNLHCSMCAVEESRKNGLKPRFIEWPFFCNVIDQLAALKVYNVGLNFGGESLLHPEFKKMLIYACAARKHGVGKVSWIDNGMLFNEDIARFVVEHKVDGLMFSLDRLGRGNDLIRVGANYDVIEKNIRRLVEIRGKSKKPEIVINKIDFDSEKQTLEFVRYWTRIVDYVRVSPLNKPHFQTYRPSYFGTDPLLKKHCPYPFYACGVLSDGRVSACACDDNAKNTLGNLNQKSLKEIWRSNEYKSFRKEALTGKFNSERPCVGCDTWKRSFKPRVESLGGGLHVILRESKVYFSVANEAE